MMPPACLPMLYITAHTAVVAQHLHISHHAAAARHAHSSCWNAQHPQVLSTGLARKLNLLLKAARLLQLPVPEHGTHSAMYPHVPGLDMINIEKALCSTARTNPLHSSGCWCSHSAVPQAGYPTTACH